MALTFNPSPPRTQTTSRRVASSASLIPASDPAFARQREARAWLVRGQAADQEAKICYTRALAMDITLQEAWQAAARRWPYQGTPIDYRRLAQTLLEERAKKNGEEEEELSDSDKATLIVLCASILLLVGALGFVLGAWLA